MKLQLRPYSLRLRHTFTIARESYDVQPTLIVELEQDGQRGYGEATSNSYYGASIAEMTAAIERVRPLLESHELGTPGELWQLLQPELGDRPFPLCAIDLAAHDLWGKLQEQPVYRLWGLSLERLPPTDYTIGIDTIEKMVSKMQEFPDWPIYKIKLGTARDIEIVRALRQHTQSVFRVDANCGWSAAETIANSHALAELGVEFIEQPLPADQWEAMREVYAKSALPIIADESCIVESDVARCSGYFHGVNIKLVKCGGLTPARRMIGAAKQLGLKTMVGCMTESSVGISAIAQLLPLLDYVDMDGALLLADDIANGVTIERGRVVFPNISGCGVQLLESL
jgi:L-alanine-DL-glutamate epimerase-like enolase superfamily enzyme